MSSETPANGAELAVQVSGVHKCYHIYARPNDRLKQFVVPRLQSMIGRPSSSYGREFWALRDVSFDVRRGETVGIIGRNGAGKSTLLQILCGTLTPTSGQTKVAGRVAALLELGAGFDVEFSGRENVYLNGSLLGLSKEEIDHRFEEIAAFADIGNFLEQPVKTYSSGMFVRLAFAISAFVSPDVLIVDEALAVGDFTFNLKCLKRIEQLKAAGCSIVFVSHDIGLVQKLCDRTVYLENGQVVMFGDSAIVTSRYITDQGKAARADGNTAAGIPGEDARNADGSAIDGQQNGWPAPWQIDQFQQGLKGTNTGNLAAQIELVEIEHSGQGAAVQFGDQMSILVYLCAKEPVTDLALSIYVIDEKGQLLVGCNTAVEQSILPDFLPGDRKRLRFQFQNRLREGNYGVTVIASQYASSTNFEYLHYLEPAIELRTISEPGRERWSIYSPSIDVSVQTIDQLNGQAVSNAHSA